eukprot:1388187-Amorphochlora_amoeboformis.AAC.1
MRASNDMEDKCGHLRNNLSRVNSKVEALENALRGAWEGDLNKLSGRKADEVVKENPEDGTRTSRRWQ